MGSAKAGVRSSLYFVEGCFPDSGSQSGQHFVATIQNCLNTYPLAFVMLSLSFVINHLSSVLSC